MTRCLTYQILTAVIMALAILAIMGLE